MGRPSTPRPSSSTTNAGRTSRWAISRPMPPTLPPSFGGFGDPARRRGPPRSAPSILPPTWPPSTLRIHPPLSIPPAHGSEQLPDQPDGGPIWHPEPHRHWRETTATTRTWRTIRTRVAPTGRARQWSGRARSCSASGVPGDHVTLVKNPNYWDSAAGPYLDRIVFKPFATSGVEDRGARGRHRRPRRIARAGPRSRTVSAATSLMVLDRGPVVQHHPVGDERL